MDHHRFSDKLEYGTCSSCSSPPVPASPPVPHRGRAGQRNHDAGSVYSHDIEQVSYDHAGSVYSVLDSPLRRMPETTSKLRSMSAPLTEASTTSVKSTRGYGHVCHQTLEELLYNLVTLATRLASSHASSASSSATTTLASTLLLSDCSTDLISCAPPEIISHSSGTDDVPETPDALEAFEDDLEPPVPLPREDSLTPSRSCENPPSYFPP